MIRAFETQDLDKIMEIWLEGNLSAHPFISKTHWEQNFQLVKSILPNAEVYVYEDGGEILGFIGMDGEYIAGIFVSKQHRGKGIGHQLLAEVKRRKRLSLHVYEKNTGAVAFYQAEGFYVEKSMIEKETGEQEYRMVFCDKEQDF